MISIDGIVINKNTYPVEGKPDRYTLDVAVPGNRSMLSVGVKKSTFDSHNIQDTISLHVNFRLYKGQVYFSEVD